MTRKIMSIKAKLNKSDGQASINKCRVASLVILEKDEILQM